MPSLTEVVDASEVPVGRRGAAFHITRTCPIGVALSQACPLGLPLSLLALFPAVASAGRLPEPYSCTMSGMVPRMHAFEGDGALGQVLMMCSMLNQ